MRRSLSFAGFLVVVLGFAAVAEAKSLTAASGQPQQVNNHYRFDREGKTYPVTVTVTKQPANGKVTTRRVKGVIDESACPDRNANCLSRVGQPITQTHVIYTSKKGFRGVDTFSYTRSSSDPADRFNGTSFDISVTVN